MKEIFGQIGRDRLKKRPGEFNPLLLAYLGDAVYEMFIRYHLLAKGQNRPNDIHSEAVQFVSATAQAEALRQVQAKLTEEEKDGDSAWKKRQIRKCAKECKNRGLPL